MSDSVRIGIVGCGNISDAYFDGCKAFDILEVAACADLDSDRARAKAEEHGVAKACSVEDLLADDEIEIVVDLTTPKAHTEVNLAAIRAGKSVYCEKPLAVDREDGRSVLEAAAESGVLVGCAPDTFLGAGGQTARKLIDDGAIGRPVAGVAFMAGRGHESWHPSPEFYYEVGGGPMFDMGPYYLTGLVNLLGPVKRVCGSTAVSFAERTITSEPKNGKVITVETSTHLAGVLDFECGVLVNILMSFDVVGHHLPVIEIYGESGSMAVPDPNGFGGPVSIKLAGEEWHEVELTHSDEVRRGIGVADMASALTSGRPPRVSGELAFHVLDVMAAFDESSASGRHVEITSSCDRPAPLPVRLQPGTID